jgi:hypothetical protein
VLKSIQELYVLEIPLLCFSDVLYEKFFCWKNFNWKIIFWIDLLDIIRSKFSVCIACKCRREKQKVWKIIFICLNCVRFLFVGDMDYGIFIYLFALNQLKLVQICPVKWIFLNIL